MICGTTPRYRTCDPGLGKNAAQAVTDTVKQFATNGWDAQNSIAKERQEIKVTFKKTLDFSFMKNGPELNCEVWVAGSASVGIGVGRWWAYVVSCLVSSAFVLVLSSV